MSKRVKTVVEMEPGAIPTDSYGENTAERAPNENAEQREITQLAHADKKGAAWRRLMQQRYPKAVKSLERLATLGTWNNYHYTQAEIGAVVRKLGKLVERIAQAHAPRGAETESPLSMPWEE